jgi:hypothetical protein
VDPVRVKKMRLLKNPEFWHQIEGLSSSDAAATSSSPAQANPESSHEAAMGALRDARNFQIRT